MVACKNPLPFINKIGGGSILLPIEHFPLLIDFLGIALATIPFKRDYAYNLKSQISFSIPYSGKNELSSILA